MSALAPAAEENSTHLHRCQEGLVPAYTHFILRSGLDEEITEDFFFSPNLFPLFHCVSSRPLLDAESTGLKGDAALLLLISSCRDRYCPGVQNQSGQEGTGCLRTSVATCIQVHRAPVPLQLPAI